MDPSESPKPAPFIALLAYALIGLGIYVLCFVLTEIHATFSNINTSKFIADISHFLSEQPLYLQPGHQPDIIGDGTARIVAMSFFVLFALLGSSIAIGLIRAGAQILSPEFAYAIHRLRLRIDALVSQIKR